MSDIEQRLREAHPISQQYANGSKILLEAADEIARLQAENEALRAKADLFRRACEDLLDERPLEQAFILRKQAEAVEEAASCFGGRDFAEVRLGLSEQAQRLRTQATALERQSVDGVDSHG